MTFAEFYCRPFHKKRRKLRGKRERERKKNDSFCLFIYFNTNERTERFSNENSTDYFPLILKELQINEFKQ